MILERGYDPERDLLDPADSVFCAHGAGFTVKWDQVEQYMHLPLQKELRQQRPPESAPAPRTAAYHGTQEEDRELMAIFERTYGPVKSRQLFAPAKNEAATAPQAGQAASQQREILLVDGFDGIAK